MGAAAVTQILAWSRPRLAFTLENTNCKCRIGETIRASMWSQHVVWLSSWVFVGVSRQKWHYCLLRLRLAPSHAGCSNRKGIDVPPGLSDERSSMKKRSCTRFKHESARHIGLTLTAPMQTCFWAKTDKTDSVEIDTTSSPDRAPQIPSCRTALLHHSKIKAL